MSDASHRGWGRPCHVTGGLARVTFSTGARVMVARRIAPLVKYLGEESIRRGYSIRKSDTGGYNCRRIRGSSRMSNHSWGLAIDFNWRSNPMGSTRTDMPSWFVALWESHGFRWGGHYHGRKDTMHMEFMGTPADADRWVHGLGHHSVAAHHVRAAQHVAAHPMPRPTIRQTTKHYVNAAHMQWHLKGWHRANHRVPDPGPIDGVFGSRSVSSLRGLQQHILKIHVDGVYGPVTDRHFRRLAAYLSGH